MNQQIAALQSVSRCLSCQSKSISSLRTAILSDQLSWEAVVSLANNHLPAPAMWVELKMKDLVDEGPGELRDYLSSRTPSIEQRTLVLAIIIDTGRY